MTNFNPNFAGDGEQHKALNIIKPHDMLQNDQQNK